MPMKKVSAASVAVIGFILFATLGSAAAQEQNASGGFMLGPARFTLSLAPGESTTVDVQLTNREGVARTYDLIAEDFAADPAQEGNPQFYGDAKGGPFPAGTWLQFEARPVELEHGDQATISVTVRVPADAEPGDHQAALIVARKLEEQADGINVIPRVASLFIITVEGEVVQDGSLSALDVRNGFLEWSVPVTLALTAQNQGTVHMQPTGEITITNLFGSTVAELPVEDFIILRDSARTREFFWEPEFALGYYRATATLTAWNAPMEPMSVSFMVLPLLPMLITVIIVIVLLGGWHLFRSRFEIHRKAEQL